MIRRDIFFSNAQETTHLHQSQRKLPSTAIVTSSAVTKCRSPHSTSHTVSLESPERGRQILQLPWKAELPSNRRWYHHGKQSPNRESRTARRLTQNPQAVVDGDDDDVAVAGQDAPVDDVAGAFHVRASVDIDHHGLLTALIMDVWGKTGSGGTIKNHSD